MAGGQADLFIHSLAEREAVFGSGNVESNSFSRFEYGASVAAGIEVNRLVIGLIIIMVWLIWVVPPTNPIIEL